jgi:hypothetical protein
LIDTLGDSIGRKSRQPYDILQQSELTQIAATTTALHVLTTQFSPLWTITTMWTSITGVITTTTVFSVIVVVGRILVLDTNWYH